MRIIGLTGSIACGKSTVSVFLKSQPGCFVIDGDQLSRDLTCPGGAALPAIRQCFGSSFFRQDGSLDRKALGNLVFSDPAALSRLDSLMAPYLRHLTEQKIAEARSAGVSLCFLDFPLLFEKGYDRLCDTVWCVWLPVETQISRLIARDGLTREDAENRIRSVLSSDEKAARSQVVLDNSGTREDMLAKLPFLLEKEKSISPRRRRSDLYADPESITRPHTVDPGDPSSVPSEKGSFSRRSGRAEAPSVPDQAMARPDSVRKKPSERRKDSDFPSWLLVCMLVSLFLFLSCLTGMGLMNAYLSGCQKKHEDEAKAVLDHYPVLYREWIEKYADEFNLEPAFVAAVIRNESSFDPHAESRVGARGLMQLMPDTASWINDRLKLPDYSFDLMWDPETNIRFGCWYLNYLSGLFNGDTVCVISGYHAGQNRVASWLYDSRYSPDGKTLWPDKIPIENTKIYVERVTKAYGIYTTLYFTPPADSPDPDGDADTPAVVSVAR